MRPFAPTSPSITSIPRITTRLASLGQGLLLACLLLAAPPSRADLLDTVQQRGELKICIWPDYFGISYRHPYTGVYQGMDIELSRRFAAQLGVKASYVDTDFSHLIDDLRSRKCDVAMMGVGITAERAAMMDFSQPYLRSDVYAITTRDNASLKTWDDLDQPGRIIVVQKGTFMEGLMRQQLLRARLLVATQPGQREREVESGRADAFITDYPYSQRMLLNTDWARRIAPNRPIKLTEYAYATQKGESRMLARLNTFVQSAKKDGSLREAAAPYQLLPILVQD